MPAARTDPLPGREPVAQLRLVSKKPVDWAFAAEGFLLLYDPTIVTAKVFDRLFGLQTVSRVALAWMYGAATDRDPIVDEPQHWSAADRRETAARVGLLVELGWRGAIASLPLTVACNGADVRISSRAPSAEELGPPRRFGRRQVPVSESHPAWLELRSDRLGLTWDFLLGFTAAQERCLLGPGRRAVVKWPAGRYRAVGWTLPDLEDEAGTTTRHFVRLVNTRSDASRRLAGAHEARRAEP
jgi:hypothetical protein